MSSSRDPKAASPDFAGMAALAEAAGDIAARGDGPDVPDDVLQAIFASAMKIYEQKFEVGHRIAPFADPGISATTVFLVATMMLKGANLELFELGMWQAFSGVK